VVGPLEASLAFARTFGHRFAIVTDHQKAVPELEDRLRVYGQEANCRSISAVGWFVDDMVRDPERVARDAYVASKQVLEETAAETVIIGCTIVSACYEQVASEGDEALRRLSVINPNLMAVKQAEVLADLAAQGQYRMSRKAYYQHLRDHDVAQADELAVLLGSRSGP
jgi:allantoin racemase